MHAWPISTVPYWNHIEVLGWGSTQWVSNQKRRHIINTTTKSEQQSKLHPEHCHGQKRCWHTQNIQDSRGQLDSAQFLPAFWILGLLPSKYRPPLFPLPIPGIFRSAHGPFVTSNKKRKPGCSVQQKREIYFWWPQKNKWENRKCTHYMHKLKVVCI